MSSANTHTATSQVYGPYPGWDTLGSYTRADGSSVLAWISYGTYDSNDVYSGDSIVIWVLNASGAVTSTGTVYGPYSGWSYNGIGVNNDGSLIVYWTNSTDTGDEVVIWNMNSSGIRVSSGPVYGPYSGWSLEEAGAPGDGTSRLKWVNQENTGKAVTVWTMNSRGAVTSTGQVYGPYSGWDPSGFNTFPDGTTSIVWGEIIATKESITTWRLDPTGKETSEGPVYGPYPGWYLYQGVAANDDTSRLVWDNPQPGGDEICVWTVNSSGVVTANSHLYGPYSGEHFGVAAPETYGGDLKLYWVTQDSSYDALTAVLWTLDDTGKELTIGPVYGPNY